MSNVLRFKRTVPSAVPARKKDPWCAKLIMEDGRQIAGGAAREARLKAAGGVETVLRDMFDRASALASARKTG